MSVHRGTERSTSALAPGETGADHVERILRGSLVVALVFVLTSVVPASHLHPLTRDHASTPVASEPSHLVLAHYMPSFRPLGINPADEHWDGYAEQFDPTRGHSGGLTARPILYDPEGSY